MDRIRFLSDQIYETGGPGKGPLFKAGFVLDAADVGKALGIEATSEYAAAFLQRWVNRGVAVAVDRRAPASDPAVVEDATAEPAVVTIAEPPAPPAVSQPLGFAKRGRPTNQSDPASRKDD